MPLPIERYVRASVEIYGSKRRVEGCIELGLLYSPSERPSQFRPEMIALAQAALSRDALPTHFDENFADALQAAIDRRFVEAWGHRPRFIEIWRGVGADEEPLIQVYAPCGMPRVR